MESNIKGLVSAGHEMASELKAECGAVDMRSVAKLISDLATQLEVQLVRNALAEDQQKPDMRERASPSRFCIAVKTLFTRNPPMLQGCSSAERCYQVMLIASVC